MESCLILPGLERLLLRRGLPRDYVRRTIDELDAHRGDVAQSDPRSTAALATSRVLGDPRALAARLVQDYRSARFAGRRPLLTFVVAPIPLALLVWVLCLAVGAAIAFAVVSLFGEYSLWTFTALEFLHRLSAIAPQLLCGWWFVRLSRRSGWGWAWAVPACGLVALTWWLFQSELVLPTAPGAGQFRVGLGASSVLVWPAVAIVLAAWGLVRFDRQAAAA